MALTLDWVMQFRQLSLTADVIDDGAFEKLKTVIGKYLTESLEADFYQVVLDGASIKTGELERPALATMWSRWNKGVPTIEVLSEDGVCPTQISLSYYQRTPLWIASASGGELNDGDCVDLWSRTPDLPPYLNFDDSRSRTAIVLPLEYGRRTFGVLNLEFDNVLAISPDSQRVCKHLAASLARLIWQYETRRTQANDSMRAIEELEAMRGGGRSPLVPRTVFLSTPERCDSEVLDVIRSVLAEFPHLFEVRFWKEQALSGDIKQQVRNELISSTFGVCYLSEFSASESSGGEHAPTRFIDNPNVIFEAGMLQAMHEIRKGDSDRMSRWIPVRETGQYAPPVPFNFATDRIVEVPRHADGRLDAETMRNRLAASVTSMVANLRLR